MIRLAFILSSLFVLSGCSVIGGHSFTNIFMGIIATIFFVGCNNEFYKVKPVNVVNPEPEPQPGSCVAGTPLELGVSDYLQAGDVYVPNAELQEVDATSTNLKDHATSYSNCDVNYFKLDRAATSTLIAAPAGEASKDFVVVTTDYLNVAQPTIELGDGDDTIVFEGYQGFVNTVGSVNLGAGDDKVILGAAEFNDYINPGSLILGPGADKVYIGPIENYSIINMDFSEDKIVLTGGLSYADLEFVDNWDHIAIQIREKNSHPDEYSRVRILRVKKTASLTNVSQLSNPSNFEVGGVVNAKKGLYKSAGSNFSVSSYPTNSPSYLIDFHETGDIDVNNTYVQSYSNGGIPFEYVSNPYDYVTTIPFDYIGGATIPYDYVTSYAGSGFANFDRVKGAYFTAPYYSPSSIYWNSQTVNFTAYSSERNFFRISPNMPQYKRTFNMTTYSGDSSFVSHVFDVSNVVATMNNFTIYVNGKPSGSIEHSTGNTFIVLSREGSGVDITPGDSYTFLLSDNIDYSDLTFFEEVATGLIHIQLTDDSGKKITIVRIKSKTLSDVSSPSHF